MRTRIHRMVTEHPHYQNSTESTLGAELVSTNRTLVALTESARTNDGVYATWQKLLATRNDIWFMGCQQFGWRD